MDRKSVQVAASPRPAGRAALIGSPGAVRFDGHHQVSVAMVLQRVTGLASAAPMGGN